MFMKPAHSGEGPATKGAKHAPDCCGVENRAAPVFSAGVARKTKEDAELGIGVV
jgi:hypothetical protein